MIFSSMILLKIYSECFVVFPFKRDTPWPIDVDTVAFRRSAKAMEVEARHIQFRQCLRLIQRIQAAQATGLQVWLYAPAMASFK